MERGSNSNGGFRRLNSAEIAEETRLTVQKIKQRHSRCRISSRTIVTFHDMTSVGYGWLLPGWVAEERRVAVGRVYRYYYDPEGYLYRSQRMVLETLEECGIIVLDT